LFIEFPDELIDELGLARRRYFKLGFKGFDGIVLSKVHDASGYQVEEE
jgi:hypothetical protein